MDCEFEVIDIEVSPKPKAVAFWERVFLYAHKRAYINKYFHELGEYLKALSNRAPDTNSRKLKAKERKEKKSK